MLQLHFRVAPTFIAEQTGGSRFKRQPPFVFVPVCVYMRCAKNSRSAAMVAVVWATLGPPMVLRLAMQV